MDSSNNPSFLQMIKQQKQLRGYLFLWAGLSVLSFAVFKHYYPFPNFLPDSFSYLDAAFKNESVNVWPIGYSMFLRLFSTFFSHSDIALVLFQYLALEASIAYFLLTIHFLLQPGKWAMRILLAVLTVNPLLLQTANLIAADALFSALSIVWLTQLIWLLYRPSLRLAVWHAVVLLLAFTFRYNALWYPFISIGVLLLLRWPFKLKLTGIALIILLPVAFVGNTMYHYKQATGTAQFSGFSGWQLAANALYAYAQVPPKAPEQVPHRFKQLHQISNRHMDSIRTLPSRPDSLLGIYYLWNDNAPLRKYLWQKWAGDSTTSYLKKWANVSPLYGDYGAYLIKQYPGAYARHYLWPNLVNYYSPPSEFLGIYNMGSDTVDDIARQWFGYRDNKVRSVHKDHMMWYMNLFPPVLAMVNILFLLAFIAFLILGGFKKSSPLAIKVMLMAAFVWAGNLGFSVLASPIVLRYQVFPMIMALVFGAWLLGFLVKESVKKEEKAGDGLVIGKLPTITS